jgi:hypothetical protein
VFGSAGGVDLFDDDDVSKGNSVAQGSKGKSAVGELMFNNNGNNTYIICAAPQPT